MLLFLLTICNIEYAQSSDNSNIIKDAQVIVKIMNTLPDKVYYVKFGPAADRCGQKFGPVVDYPVVGMANYFDGVLDDELDLFPVGPSTSTESCESNNTTEITETAESMETAESSDTDVSEERVKTKAQKSCTVAKKA
ncbi:hypothetical protein DdX_04180 [Ditylenchus destructor]|uniref:Uncharacterized protein n=1 Tax=Ditylenchus destructor TaxID=166010 RepID=A0AAD4NAP1_9BILA|nr:hypothetical protein DdX_04180 [Ditylenchus destructor]